MKSTVIKAVTLRTRAINSSNPLTTTRGNVCVTKEEGDCNYTAQRLHPRSAAAVPKSEKNVCGTDRPPSASMRMGTTSRPSNRSRTVSVSQTRTLNQALMRPPFGGKSALIDAQGSMCSRPQPPCCTRAGAEQYVEQERSPRFELKRGKASSKISNSFAS